MANEIVCLNHLDPYTRRGFIAVSRHDGHLIEPEPAPAAAERATPARRFPAHDWGREAVVWNDDPAPAASSPLAVFEVEADDGDDVVRVSETKALRSLAELAR